MQTTIFPQAVGLGETWDVDAVRRVGRIEGSEALIEITDHGDGLTPEDADRVFEDTPRRQARIHASTSPAGGRPATSRTSTRRLATLGALPTRRDVVRTLAKPA